MNYRFQVICLSLMFISSMLLAQNNYQLKRSLFSSGGIIAASTGAHTLSASVGEVVIGMNNASQYQVISGFWAYAALVDELDQKPFPDVPTVYNLSQNYPNPFNPTTTISYQLPMVSDVELSIYNMLGQKIATLISARQPAGYYQVIWQGRNDDGRPAGSGIYVYRLTARSQNSAIYVRSMKMIYLK